MKHVGPLGERESRQAWLYLDRDVKASKVIWEKKGQGRVKKVGKTEPMIHYFHLPFIEDKYSVWHIIH